MASPYAASSVRIHRGGRHGTVVLDFGPYRGFAASLAQAQDKPAFVFTAIPDQDESRLIERFTKVAEQLQPNKLPNSAG